MIHFPDSPREISLDLLRKLDAEQAGTWHASVKVDGRRRMAYKNAGVFTYHAKNRDDCAEMPFDLRREFESFQWPDGIGLDMEWAGPRHTGDQQSLWIFDLLATPHNGETFNMTYETRMAMLDLYCMEAGVGLRESRIHVVPRFYNPGLCERFAEQMADPLSEGLVVRRRDSKIKGHWERSIEGEHLYKIKFKRKRGAE